MIWVSRDDKVFFGLDRVSVEALSGQIRESVRNGAEKRIYLNVDQRTKCGVIADVVDQIQMSGVQNVSILTEWRYVTLSSAFVPHLKLFTPHFSENQPILIQG